MLSTQPPHPNPSFSFDQANYSSIYRIQRIDTHSIINRNWQINYIHNPILSLMVTPSSPDLSLLDYLKSIFLPSLLSSDIDDIEYTRSEISKLYDRYEIYCEQFHTIRPFPAPYQPHPGAINYNS